MVGLMARSEVAHSDLWWLRPGEVGQFRFLYLGHHYPMTDDDQPSLDCWFHSLAAKELSHAKVLYSVSFLNEWRKLCNDTNVFRSLKLFESTQDNTVVMGPFLVDIDNSRWDEVAQVYEEDLQDALHITQRAVQVLTGRWRIPKQDIRIFFSGRKGFNLEVRPEALGIDGDYTQQLKASSVKLEELVGALTHQKVPISTNTVSSRQTVIDTIYGTRRHGIRLKHPFIRLHESFNVWTAVGEEKRRRKIELTLEELDKTEIAQILHKSENKTP